MVSEIQIFKALASELETGVIFVNISNLLRMTTRRAIKVAEYA